MAAAVEIETREFARGFATLRNDLARAVERRWEALAREGAYVMRGSASEGRYHRRTGALQRSMHGYSLARGPLDLAAEVTATAFHAAFIERGTRGPICAKRAKYLRFFWPRVGHVVFRKCVRGITARRYALATQRVMTPRFRDGTQATVDMIARQS